MSQHGRTPQHALRAEGVSVAYGRTIIVGIDLAFPHGAFTALVGPNGSGKSTILRALAGLLPPREGTVLLDGKSISSLPSKEVARQIGVLSQGPVAPGGVDRARPRRTGPLSASVAVRALVGRGRGGLRGGARADRHGTRSATACSTSLSGGKRQRAWIAMALAQQTDILLLDEPTTFLDLAHQIEILDLIASLVRTRRQHRRRRAARPQPGRALRRPDRAPERGSDRRRGNSRIGADGAGDRRCVRRRLPHHSGPRHRQASLHSDRKKRFGACLSNRSHVANLQQIRRNCGNL